MGSPVVDATARDSDRERVWRSNHLVRGKTSTLLRGVLGLSRLATNVRVAQIQ
jgi:hypothetical protein